MSYNSLIATAAVALAAAMPVAAQAKADEKTTGFFDGVDYEYTSRVKGGRLILTGRWDRGQKPFYLVVSKGWVHGRVGSNPVWFRLNEAQADAVQVAVR